jgi:tripartite-type tricarboxylate transporter receptor subunit TctC
MTTTFVRYAASACIIGAVLASAAQGQTAAPSPAQPYPTKPIRLIVGYTPGGGTDVMSRVLAKYLSESLKQTVIVDNRPGAGGLLATQLVANAPPDGYTLLTTPSTHAINPGLYAKLPYDSIKDFTPISLIAASPNTFVVHPSLPVHSVRELITLARSRPGDLTFASAGVGSTTHLAGEYFRSMAQIKTVHVPYKGSSQAEIDLGMGQVHYMIDSTPAALPNIKSGRTRALATTGAKRFSALPDVPTVAESGLPQYESVSWWGIIGPAGMPQAIVDRLNTEIAKIMLTPEVRKLTLAQGAEATTSTPAQFLEYMKGEMALYTRVIKEAAIKLE